MNNIEQPIKQSDVAIISAMSLTGTAVPNELVREINARIAQLARDLGFNKKFRFAIVTKVAVTSEIIEALNLIYQAAGWKSLRFMGARSRGSDAHGFLCEFEIEAVER